jgi:nucleoid-associated protein YgaU
MNFNRVKHQKPSDTAKRAGKTVGKLALAGAVVAAPALITTVPAHATNWDAIAKCESGGNWHTHTGNGFAGGLQFTPSTWHANGGSGSPANASRAEQIQVAKNVKQSQGIGAWPVCGKHANDGGGSSHVSSSHTAASEQSAHHTVHHSTHAVHHSTHATHHSTHAVHHSTHATHHSTAPVHHSTHATHHSTDPVHHSTAPVHHSTHASHHSTQASSSGGTYAVKSGDTLHKIADAHHVAGGWHHLYELNSHKISNPNLIYPGQALAL